MSETAATIIQLAATAKSSKPAKGLIKIETLQCLNCQKINEPTRYCTNRRFTKTVP